MKKKKTLILLVIFPIILMFVAFIIFVSLLLKSAWNYVGEYGLSKRMDYTVEWGKYDSGKESE
jgi:flagellar basal body-associated protein FliL